MYEFLIVMINY